MRCNRLAAVSLGLTLLIAALLVSTTARVLAHPAPVALADFDSRLAATRELVAGLKDPVTASERQALAAEADAWEAITAVELADGRELPVTTRLIAVVLRDPGSSRSELRDFVDTLVAVRAEWTGAGHTDADLTSLATILSDPRYSEASQGSGLQAWLADLWRRFLEWVRSLGGDSAVPDLNLAWVVALGLLLAALLVAGVWGLRRSVVRERAVASPHAGTEATSADEALSRADALAAAGDYRQAVRLLYLGTLLALDEKGALRYDRALTNHEYLTRLRGRPDLATGLSAVIDVFDRVWYGEQSVGADVFARYAADVNDLRGRA